VIAGFSGKELVVGRALVSTSKGVVFVVFLGYAKRKCLKTMDCKSPSLCFPPLNPIQQMKSLILHIRQFFKQVEYGWSQLGFFFQFGSFESLVVFFPSYSFLSPKFSLFCHHSSKIQIEKEKKHWSQLHNMNTEPIY
jgi:hypothetical protein